MKRREAKSKGEKGKFHEKMGTIKDRNGMDLTEAEDMKKRWQEYIKEIVMTQITTTGWSCTGPSLLYNVTNLHP